MNEIAPGPDTKGVPIQRPIITDVEDVIDNVRWDTEPEFLFPSQAEAMQTLEHLGKEVVLLRQQMAHTMRYIKLAARSANGAELMSKNAIITTTGLARQTVLDMFKGE